MGAKAVPELVAAMDSDKAQARELAAIILGEIGDAAALGPLHRALRETAQGSMEYMLIQKAIGKIEGPSEPPSYLNMREAELAHSCAQKEAPSCDPMYF